MDLFNADSVASPARRIFAITPHDINELSTLPKAIRANVAGDVVLRTVDSDTDVTLTLAVGEIVPVRAQYIRATGTTATLHGLA
jgi:hypothetical protein